MRSGDKTFQYYGVDINRGRQSGCEGWWMVNAKVMYWLWMGDSVGWREGSQGVAQRAMSCVAQNGPNGRQKGGLGVMGKGL